MALAGVSVAITGQAPRLRRGPSEYIRGREVAASEALVRFRPLVATAQVERDIDADVNEQLGATSWRRLRSRRQSSGQLLSTLASRAEVLAVEPNAVIHATTVPSDPYFPQLWGLKNFGNPDADIRALGAWNVSTGGRTTVVGVVDSGLDYTHPDLQANIWSAPAAFTVTIAGRTIHCPAGSHGFNAIALTCDPMDDFNHGTHVAGTIGAVGNNGLGVTGINWAASLMGLKFLDSTGSGTLADAINAIEFAVQAKARFASTSGANVRVLSNSWGGSDFSQALLDEIQRAAGAEMLFVAAAGNDATNSDTTPFYPAGYAASNVIAVAASNDDDTLASFSNFGAASVDLAAPGVGIVSTIPGGGYGIGSGTSMATPHVSGAAALVLSRCTLTTAELRSAILTTVDPVPWLNGFVATNGRLNVENAIRSCAAPGNAAPTVALTAPSNGATFTAPVSIAVTATAADGDGAVSRVDFYAGSTWIGAATSSPYTIAWSNVAAGNYKLTAIATDNSGASTASSVISIAVRTATGSLPASWFAQDVGSVTPAGTSAFAAGAFTVSGAGADIWGTADAFQFVYQPLAGDGEVIARVATLQNTNSWAKAGVMIRDGLTAGARYAALVVTPGNGLAFQRRAQPGGASTYTAGSGTAPTWLRLARSGSTIRAYGSSDGATWTLVGTDTLSLSLNVSIGLAVTSHADGVLMTATFDNVTTVVGSAPSNTPPTLALILPASGATFTAPATIGLAATASDSDGTVSRVDFYAGATLIGTATSSPYTATWSNVAAGSYAVTAIATDNAGATTTSSSVTITVQPAGSSLPAPWLAQDIGSVTPAGTASYATGTFTVQGAGADIWDAADAFQFVYQPLSGDGQIVARAGSLQNTNSWAKAGVMIREEPTTGARYAALFVTPGNGLAFQRRLTAGGASAYTGSSGAAPIWVKLVRSGATVSAYRSADGATWTLVGTDTISLASNVYVGLAVTSHSNGVLATATFDNVTIGAAGAPPNAPPSVTLTSPASGASFTAPATLALAATASDSDGTVSRVEFYAGATLVATAASSPYTATWTGVAAGSYTLTAVATDNGGATATSAAVPIAVQPAGSTLPTPWLAQDIGSVTPAGTAAYATGTFTVQGAGADIWDTADAFQFVYQPLAGDGQIVARVGGLQNTHAWAKAGLMIRETLTAGARYAALFVTPANGLAFQRRTATGGATTYTPGGGGAPLWVKLVRSSATLSAYTSATGSTWTLIGADTISLASSVYVGLAVTSHANGTLTTATVDNVTVGASGAPINVPPTVTLTAPATDAVYTAPATIPLGAIASDSDGSVAKVDFYAGTTLVRTVTTSPYSTAWTNVAAGSYPITAVATDNAGATSTSAAVTATVLPSSSTLPAPWIAQDIGSVTPQGSASFAGSTFTISGAGGDIWDSADAFQFVYQPFGGDGQIIARVTALQNTHPWAKAGVMIRETLAAGARYAALFVTPGNGLAFQRRTATGGSSTYTPGVGSTALWLKLARSGSTLTAYSSTNGTTWTLVGTDTIALSSSVSIGIGVTSHANGTLTTAAVDKVAVTP